MENKDLSNYGYCTVLETSHDVISIISKPVVKISGGDYFL